MKLWQQMIAAALLLPGIAANAADSPLRGVPITINLTNLPQISVEKPEGGWYDTLTLDNSSGRDVTLYQAQVPVKVSIRNEHNFSVTLVNPLILTHSTNPSLTFSTALVEFGNSTTALQTLSATPIAFSNPIPLGDTSVGNYLLSVSAHQPAGARGDITGDYVGELMLLFEVNI
ncbi:fimbrial protein [Serratia fonticola]|uniref:fimbrial protein n=1 Tax=Serratia fonticola TaxID=47917 RepID=UPI0024DE6EB4|nr:fimbrial protein [Serratia fonticola]MDK2377473.1 fimbrial protein [Serratia fonticola]